MMILEKTTPAAAAPHKPQAADGDAHGNQRASKQVASLNTAVCEELLAVYLVTHRTCIIHTIPWIIDMVCLLDNVTLLLFCLLCSCFRESTCRRFIVFWYCPKSLPGFSRTLKARPCPCFELSAEIRTCHSTTPALLYLIPMRCIPSSERLQQQQ